MKKDFSILGIVVTYYPDKMETISNILSIIEDLDVLIIWENTPIDERATYRVELPHYAHKIIYMGLNVNVCIAKALNTAVKYGLSHGFSHFLTMDQDGCFQKGHFKQYLEIVSKNRWKYHLLGPNPNGLNQPIVDTPIKKSTLITSGSVFDLSIFKITGLFNESYKIDCVDYEFCFRAANKGIYSFMVSSVIIKQNFGRMYKTKLGFNTFNYPPLRLYFISRNNIWLYRGYPKLSKFSNLLNWILIPFVKIILTENNKWEKTKSICRGIFDGIRTMPKQINEVSEL